MKHIKPNYFARFLIIFLFSCNTIKTDYYLPKGFTGDVAVVYDCEDGQDVQTKNGRQQILIPDSGLILLKTQFKEGEVDEKFYLKVEKDSFREVYRYSLQKDTCCAKKYIFFERAVEVVGKGKNNKSFASMIDFFFVGSALKSDTNRYFFENHVQNLLSSKAYH